MDELEIEVRKLVPDDGDVVVMSTPHPISDEVADRMAKYISKLGERVGKRIECIVLSDGIQMQILKTSQLPDWVKS